MKTIKGKVTVGNRIVEVVSNKISHPNNGVAIKTDANSGNVRYSEVWTLPHDNPHYTQEQAQKDFEAHQKKVALGAAGRAVAFEVAENLV
jgi:hypothetical protein